MTENVSIKQLDTLFSIYYTSRVKNGLQLVLGCLGYFALHCRKETIICNSEIIVNYIDTRISYNSEREYALRTNRGHFISKLTTNGII